ncbi:MAG: UbiA family prenyltransferase, partial [Rhodospirillaceae bacterium]|nr:UbiA family prenyltransferase [Rhodospirillaceae bacterium]
PDVALSSLVAFIAFSMVASSAYLLNDLSDLASDRSHPRKRNRPFASGSVNASSGVMMVPLLLAGAIALAALLGGTGLVLVLVGYFALSTAYTLWLKRQLVIDLCILAALYALRLLAGSEATAIPLSSWMLVFSFFLFFSLAAIKREAELADSAERQEEQVSGRAYRVENLNLVTAIGLALGLLSVVVLAFYVNSPEVRLLYSDPRILWLVCPVMVFWIARMTLSAHRGRVGDDPVVYAARDPISLVCGALILAIGLFAGIQ